ncbi:MAG: phosphoenolpyruvate carboxykinase (ATP) [Bacteroidota bacterium]|nr:phosphoenolpyruvate carboxykinase (ATP) [Bacteroidota bacterium]MDP4215342.1 phosphoenolpyruvate carboxykinase (ATP) [Bacteroidota bacterium]MDP4244474.1 phosphoenolpyruvate carboxykinase (ATP) [Bacteroidota bacterium]MDP4258771.1 phosphoenolpyruvate carboxykinase (ATP) [Bacteroidota bacterium]
MPLSTIVLPADRLMRLGLRLTGKVHYQLTPDALIGDILRRGEGMPTDTGALLIRTGEFTGRSPKDRYIVKDTQGGDPIHWNDFNQPLDSHFFEAILNKTISWFNQLPEVWVRDCHVCADERFRLRVRIINETPAINLFAYNMFLRPSAGELEDFHPEWHVLSAPGLRLNPAQCGTRQSNAVVISFRHRMILLAGTGYTGETKKAIFTILNYLLPLEKDVLPMHCAANVGKKGDTALFFGLSGTGKTTLSADPDRRLIGDDEHGWSADNVFNFEGGCYAKCINLKEEKEPEIYRAIRPGALVENARFYPGTNQVNFEDGSITENTRVSYPLHYIGNALKTSVGNSPRNIFFLTCDAYGVLPPISRLTPGQAMYQFISGYTAKVAGTETGITEPKSTFSACFGAPFLPLNPCRYAEMLGRNIRENGVKVWLVNTGWSGGPYGKGSRLSLAYTRAMVTAALNGSLDGVEYSIHPVFGMAIPQDCPGVPSLVLNPRNTWPDKGEYDEMATRLAGWFTTNFAKYAGDIPEEILAAAPGK